MDHHFAPETLRIGKYYKWMNVCVVVWLVTQGIAQLAKDNPESAVAIGLLVLLILLLNAVVFLYSITRLSLSLGGNYRFLPLGLLVLIIAPFVFLRTADAFAQISSYSIFVAFFILVVISWKTRKVLESRGVRMGILGAKGITLLGKEK
ncbi:MAG: hypothetical protein Q7S29_02000 [Candidatus Peribacter sp.]|nr:hypothetical protein [Candidatus Peribacter sp.]